MKPQFFIILAVGAVLSALPCSAATLIVDDYGARVVSVSQATNASRSSFELIDFDLSPNVHTPFFRASGFDLDDTRHADSAAPWLKTGFITLDSADFPLDSPLANAEIAKLATSTTPAPPATCVDCESTPESPSTEPAPTRAHVTYTLVMTSFPRDAEGVYTNAVYFNRKEAHQPYAVLMLREGLAAVEPLVIHQ